MACEAEIRQWESSLPESAWIQKICPVFVSLTWFYFVVLRCGVVVLKPYFASY